MSMSSRPRPIVVGVDGSAGSRAALRFAFAEAVERDAPVRVVTTWMLGFPNRDVVTDRAFEEESTQARLMQDDEIRLALDDMDERPEYTQIVVNDLSGPALIDTARDASLLVVGTGRRNALSRAFLGSVSEFCVRHSPVPIVVVPDPARVEDDRDYQGVLSTHARWT